MTDHIELEFVKNIAKRLARARRIPHHVALDQIASQLDHPHWNALTVAWGKTWRPSLQQIDFLENLLVAATSIAKPFGSAELGDLWQSDGSIDGHAYSIRMDFVLVEIQMRGRGWSIYVGHAPSEKPMVEITDRRIKANPVRDPAFVSKALVIAKNAAEQLRSQIATDWSRRSTKPDAEGRVRHPLYSDVASQWYCLHCDGVFTGKEVAGNMWHCPKCNAAPIDIFEEPFWRGTS